MDNNSFNAPIMPGNYQPTAPIQPPQQTPPPMGLKPKKFIFEGWSTFQLVIFIIVSLLAVTFIGLFIWMFIMWSNADSNIEGQINAAVTTAVSAKESELNAKFEEQQKYPYKTFTGPADYGSLTFEFPKTWSAYVAKDASSGGNLEAYFNPDVVTATSISAINALRVTIRNQSIDQVSRSYESSLKSGKLSVNIRPINGENANVYTGAVGNNIQGIVAIFKIRDKTAILQTDAMIYQEDFTHILDTVKYNS